MLAKLLPERHNLYGNSLDFKLNIYKKKWKRRKYLDKENIFFAKKNREGKNGKYLEM